MKTCPTCKRELDLTDFHRSRASKDGASSHCKSCACEKAKRWARENETRAKIRRAEYYKLRTDASKARARKWAAKNPEKRREIRLKSAEKHRLKTRIKNTAYNANRRIVDLEGCRESYRLQAALRRSRQSAAGGVISKEAWTSLVQLFETGACLYCGTYNNKLVVDHFVPVKLGGKTEAGNLLPCCFSCNSQKRDKPPQDWVRDRCGDAGYGEICWFLDFTKLALNPGLDHREV